jgi:serine/threonine protein kinase
MATEFENLGPYVIQSVLGRGGMGSVYKGVHVKSGQQVAVKVIASVLADQERFRRRFAAEIETLKRLKHANIVELIGYGEEQGHLFYSMEYVEGKSLQEMLRDSGRLPWLRVIDICIEICSALKQAHDQGIIHRDLKPANVMISESGTAKLMDFGIAKLYWGNEVTAVGSIIGTADFMPPEQAEGKPVTTRSDIYAVGSLAFAALTGRPPFTGRSVPEVLYAVRYNPVVPIRDINRDVPVELAELVEEMLAKEPLQRPPTALVVGNRLQALRAGLTRRAAQSPGPATNVPVNTTSITDQAAKSRELTSIDLDELGVPSIIVKGSPTANEGTFVLSPEEQSELVSKSLSRRVSHPPSASPHDQTVVATPSKINSEFMEGPVDGAPPTGQTHFTVVDDEDRRSAASLSGDSEPASSVGYWVSVGGLVTILLATFVSIYFYSRPMTADDLYDEVISVVEAGDSRSLVEAEPLLDEFQSRFPNDPRQSELEPYRKDLEFVRASRKILTRARFQGGVNSLDPIEQAFLDCIESRQQHSGLAARKAEAMVAVFGGDNLLSEYHKNLVDMARHMVEELKYQDSSASNPSIAALNEQIRHAMTNYPAEVKIAFLKGVIELFSDKPWAVDAVAQCRETLAVLEKKKE